MILSAEKLSIWELCPRRAMWTTRYGMPRISLMGGLYRAVDAGLRTDREPETAAENEFMTLASNPGLDISGRDVYACAMHYSKLAGIVSLALRSISKDPWKIVDDVEVGNQAQGRHTWRSACYEVDGAIRRIVLVDRWSDDRKAQERVSWRTIGEACALKTPILMTAVTIGSSHDKRRISPWTRCYQHPKSRQYRFKRTTSHEDFGATWKPIWREDAGFATAEWLTRMGKDGCMADLVSTEQVGVPKRRDAYVREMQRHALDMERWGERLGEHPPMRLAGCYGFTPCIFGGVCHGDGVPLPEAHGFKQISRESTV